jgi:anti-sigma B factor antagonist
VESQDGASVAVVALDGELDLAVLDVLEEALGAPADGAAGLVVDLSGLAFVDSAGIQALVAARDASEEAGRPSAFVVVPGTNVEQILDMTGLLERLGSHPNRDAALVTVASAGR